MIYFSRTESFIDPFTHWPGQGPFKKTESFKNQSKTLYLSIFVLPDRSKIKFHSDRPSRKSIWTNLDPKS